MADNIIPKDALAFFDAKKLTPSFDYRDIWRAEHAYNFTVAKAMQMDVLSDIHIAVRAAIANGTTFAQFKKELTPLLQQKGWWGVQSMTDPLTGKIKEVQLGSPRRLQIIYDTNVRVARAAGRWQQIQRSKQSLPYLLYQLGPSKKHREQHAAWNGILLPVDDSFWQTHYPINGWNCKCWVRQISKHEYEQLASDSSYQTDAPEISYQDWVNKRTGEVERVPKGISPGFDTNAGLLRQVSLDKALLDKVYPNDAFVQSVILSQIRQVEYSKWVDDVLKAGQSANLMTSVGILGAIERQWLAVKNIVPQTALIALEDRVLVGKKAQRHTQMGNELTADEWKAMPENLAKPEAILYDTKNETLLYIYSAANNKKVKLAVAVDFKIKPRTAKSFSLPETLNVVRSGFKTNKTDVESTLKSGIYQLINGKIQ